MRLDAKAQEMCTIAFPFGVHEHKQLPMGIVSAPDMFQETMNKLMSDLEWVWCYLDDISCITESVHKDHLRKLEPALDQLEKAGFRISLLKSMFAMDQIEYLGHWLTCDGIKPHPKKVQAVGTTNTKRSHRCHT